jgi:hypothetical protein
MCGERITEAVAYKHLKNKDYFPVNIYGLWKNGKLIQAPIEFEQEHHKLWYADCLEKYEMKRKNKTRTEADERDL